MIKQEKAAIPAAVEIAAAAQMAETQPTVVARFGPIARTAKPTKVEAVLRSRSTAIASDRPVANFVFNPMLTMGGEISAPNVAERADDLNAIAEKLKRQSKDDFKGRHFEAWLIVQAVA